MTTKRAVEQSAWERRSAEERRAAVLDGVRRSLTANEIAAEHGTSRNSVLGVAFCAGIKIGESRRVASRQKQLRAVLQPSGFDALDDDQREAAVRPLAEANQSMKQIAVALGTTLDKVRGIVERRGLVVTGKTRPRTDLHHAKRVENVSASTASLPAPRKTSVPAPAPDGGVLFLEAKTNQCRRPLWEDVATPVEEMLFCGAPTADGRSYCGVCETVIYSRPATAASTTAHLQHRIAVHHSVTAPAGAR